MDVGEEWVDRQRDQDASVRAVIVAIGPQKRPRINVRFPDSIDLGAVQDVPSTRLRAPWAEVDEHDARLAAWIRMRQDVLSEAEESAIDTVFDLLIPIEVAWNDWRDVKYSTVVCDETSLSELAGLDLAALRTDLQTTDEPEGRRFTPAATLLIAESVARSHADVVLKWIENDEKEVRERVKKGRETTDLDGKPYRTSREWEYHVYLERHRPVNELLRQWCGHRVVTAFERLAAAEAEVFRLDGVIEDLIRVAEHHEMADKFERVLRHLEEDRITPYNVRVDIARPLQPGEIPVRIEYTRRWGGYRAQY
ncbi:hypothetical protein ACL9RL_09220 [Plantibacter sp. Mn2098]|uniref:hypothetical protein n=1 Tax=Plantibacter sp. Mn2098 TaxID=3395266 RepID=UPI003BD14DC4